MAGSGNLQTFRLLRFLRSRNSSDGQANFGIQMAVSITGIVEVTALKFSVPIHGDFTLLDHSAKTRPHHIILAASQRFSH